ncbi:hypothetical protein M569_05954 [Genlisea aurea]|uniref:F-box domain-containing protein n=1 Tax=Genlisea aurea TaxID=192259 RepID=S8E8L6_9LAMI|nr:hypothetical protein M569_05954 [Genlisea aurea]
MGRRVRRKLGNGEAPNAAVDCSYVDESSSLEERNDVDWTALPGDTVIHLFSCLNYRDRASLSSTCRSWRALGKSPCLWQYLDLRSQKCNVSAAAALSSQCRHLKKLRFHGPESAEAVLRLRAKNLLELSGDCCRKMNDATLSMLVAKHESLQSLVLGPDYCEKISSEAIRVIALCCPKLRRLRLSGIHEVDASAINSLAKNCSDLADLGLIDCRTVDETSLGNISSLRFLSVAGTSNIKWNLVVHPWSKLQHLAGLDVSRTDVTPVVASRIFSSSPSLKVSCALNCPLLEADAAFASSSKNHRGGSKKVVVLAVFTDILRGVASLLDESTRNAFLEGRRKGTKVVQDGEMLNWIEWMICGSLLRVSESNPPGLLDNFWLNQGTNLLLGFMQSPQEEVQERAATTLATFVVIDDENASIDTGRAEAVMRDGGIRLLLDLARSWREGLQIEAAKAIANLSVNANVAKAVAEEGGIAVLVNLSKSANKSVAEEAAGGLWNLSVGEDHKYAIAEAGGLKALVEIIYKWSSSGGGEGVLERAAGALANLAADDKCSTEIGAIGGVGSLVSLARGCKVEGVQEQAARALANLTAHGDSNNNNAIVGLEEGALEALVQLTSSQHDGVKQEAAGALWNLSFDDRNREAIAAARGVEALVALAQSCSDASPGLQERAAGALWGLSVSESNSIAIGREGGVAALITLAKSLSEDVHETAAGALWNLAFNPGNALRILEEGGVRALVQLCSSSASKMARFMSALALTYIFDGR